MHRSLSLALSAVGLALAGCAAPPQAVQWSQVSAWDQHRFLPRAAPDDPRPAAVVLAGPDGSAVNTGAAPAAAHVVAQDGQLRLVSRETDARLQGGSTATMGAPAAPLPGDAPR